MVAAYIATAFLCISIGNFAVEGIDSTAGWALLVLANVWIVNITN